MTSIFIYEENALRKVKSKPSGRCWVDLVSPMPSEILSVSEEFDIPDYMLTAALDPEERSRFEADEDAFLILIRIPIENDEEESEIPYITRPLAIIIKGEAIVTVCSRENTVLDIFIKEKLKKFNANSITHFTLQVLYQTVLQYLRALSDIDHQTQNIEKELQYSLKNKELLRMLGYEKSLVFFTTSLRTNQIVMERLKKTSYFRMAIIEERELLEDIVVDNAQAIEMANIYTNILSGLMDTFASVISNNLNNVMRRLTNITVILMVPNLVASFYGMNVKKLPFDDNEFAYIGIGFLCIILAIISTILLSIGRVSIRR
jgi:magnesium transporter